MESHSRQRTAIVRDTPAKERLRSIPWPSCRQRHSFSLDQKQRFQQILFPNGLRFDGKSFGTFTTCIGFNYLRGISSGDSSLASQSIPSWNQIIAWLKEMETLRQIAA